MEWENRAMRYVENIQGRVGRLTQLGIPNASPRRRVPVGQPQPATSDSSELDGVCPRQNVPQSVPPKCMAQCAQQVTAGMNLAARWLSRMKKRGFPKENDKKEAGWPTL